MDLFSQAKVYAIPWGDEAGIGFFFSFGCTSSTYLASIQYLALEDTLCSNLEVHCVQINNHRRLLECKGHKMLGSGLCHNAGYSSISGACD